MTKLVKIILLLTMLCSLFFGCYSDKEESTDAAVTVETTVATFPTVEDAEEFVRLGASRLGTSRIVKIVKAQDDGSAY